MLLFAFPWPKKIGSTFNLRALYRLNGLDGHIVFTFMLIIYHELGVEVE